MLRLRHALPNDLRSYTFELCYMAWPLGMVVMSPECIVGFFRDAGYSGTCWQGCGQNTIGHDSIIV